MGFAATPDGMLYVFGGWDGGERKSARACDSARVDANTLSDALKNIDRINLNPSLRQRSVDRSSWSVRIRHAEATAAVFVAVTALCKWT
jgi:hypothetical protein